jgi:hypothetical protein
MYKFVNPLKYLSKIEKVCLIVATVLSVASFFGSFIPPILLVRIIFSLILLGSNVWGMFYVLKIQAYLTRQEMGGYSHNSYTPDDRNYNNFFDDDEYDGDNEEDYDEEEESEEEPQE